MNKVGSFLFVKGLGFVYILAFASLLVQVLGLYGETGILPIQELQYQLYNAHGHAIFYKAPSLFYLVNSDVWLQVSCIAGIASGMLILMGIMPFFANISALVLYMSFVTLGQAFLSFQWDILLLECAFLACFLIPITLRTSLNTWPSPPKIVVYLYYWTIFRIMFGSGLVKLYSKDNAWTGLTALNVHFLTQPIPHVLSWYADKLPQLIKTVSTAAVLVVECCLPFLIFTTQRFRHIAIITIMIFMGLIGLTGNYGFFNILVIFLCFMGINDSFWRKFKTFSYLEIAPKEVPKWLVPVVVSIMLMSLSIELNRFVWKAGPYRTAFHSLLLNYRLQGAYGPFSVMTTKRHEIEIQGSNDGITWKSYEFYYKPFKLADMPTWVQPHQPRLDWQMWFAALAPVQRVPWFQSFMLGIFKHHRDTVAMFKVNPFPDAGPKYLRAKLYSYEFSSFYKKKQKGEWWTKRYIGDYFKATRNPF